MIGETRDPRAMSIWLVVRCAEKGPNGELAIWPQKENDGEEDSEEVEKMRRIYMQNWPYIKGTRGQKGCGLLAVRADESFYSQCIMDGLARGFQKRMVIRFCIRFIKADWDMFLNDGERVGFANSHRRLVVSSVSRRSSSEFWLKLFEAFRFYSKSGENWQNWAHTETGHLLLTSWLPN